MAYFTNLFVLVGCFSVVLIGSNYEPGSRTIYVENHPGPHEDPPLTLIIKSKKKSCYAQMSPGIPCDCFADFAPEDQPFVQGDALQPITFFKALGKDFTGFSLKYDHRQLHYLLIPSPKQFLKILSSYGGLDQYLELVSGSEPLLRNDYFKLISKKKHPLGDITKECDAKDKNMLYHTYFHDLFNHAFGWVALPKEVKDLIAKRMEIIVHVFSELEKDFANEPLGLHLIELLRFDAAINFDSHMGSFTNLLLQQTSLGLTPKYYCFVIEPFYKKFVNLGYEEYTISEISTAEQFVREWFSWRLKTNEKTFALPIRIAVERDEMAKAAFLPLSKLPKDEIAILNQRILNSVCTALDQVMQQRSSTPESLLPHCKHVCEQIEDLYRKLPVF